MLQESIDRDNSHRKMTAKEAKVLNKLETIIDKLKRWENVQNRWLKSWLNEDEYAQKNSIWYEQLELCQEL